MKDISVVIITHNRVRSLTRMLAHHRRIYPDVPVVVVDNHSGDGTCMCVRQAFPAVTVIPLAANEGAAARNIGVAVAKTPFIAFTDDDARWEPGSLEHALAYMRLHADVGLMAVRVLVRGKAPDPICTLMKNSRMITGFLACAAVIRRKAFEDTGGFSRAMGVGGEEELVAIDILETGWRLVYVPGVVAAHYPSRIRNAARRKQVSTRNYLWTLLLRRSWSRVLRGYLSVIGRASYDANARKGLFEALPQTLAMLRKRRPVSFVLDQAMESNEAAAAVRMTKGGKRNGSW